MGKKNPLKVFTDVVSNPGKALENLFNPVVKVADQALTGLDKGIIKPVIGVADQALTAFDKGIIKPVDQGITAVDKAIIQPTIKAADKTVTSIGKTMEAVAKNPLPVIETIALTMMGVPAPLANAMVVGMNGGSIKDMATAALVSSVPNIGNGISSQLGVNAGIGNAIAKVGVQLAIGVPLDKAINNTLVSVAAQSSAPYISQQIGSVISSPAMVKALTNVAITAETGILQGQSAEQIGKAMTMTAIYSAAPVIKEWTSSPAVAADPNLVTNPNVARMGNGSPSGLSPYDPNSPTFVGPPMPANGITSPVEPYGPIESSPLDAMASTTPITPPGVIESSPLDNFDYSTLPQPDQSAPSEPYTPPVITDFKPDYSLGAGITTSPGVDPATGTGLTTPAFPTNIPESTTYPYDVAPDYSLYNPATDPNSGLGLQAPESPAIKSMGGGQGLTTPYTQPDGTTGTMGALGFTPDNAAVALGDPNSFINNPDVTGQPIMASDPAYDDPFSWFKSSGGLGGMDLSTGSTGSSSSKTSNSPLGDTVNAKVAQSYLQGIAPEAAPSDLQMAQLQQLYPTITPDLSKILLDRGMLLTPQNATVDFGSINQPTQDLNKVGSEMLSAADLANFGQQFAKGGNVQLPKGHHPEFITGRTGHYAQGRGTGQSDDIPAVLYAGDYVIDADTVAALGDGSSKAGAGALEQFRQSIPVSNSGGGQQIPAKIADSEFVLPSGFVTALGNGSNKQGSKMLDAMREQIRAHKRSAPETKIPPKARSPLQYMQEAMKG